MGIISLANWRRPSMICVKTRIFVSRQVPRLITPPGRSLVAHVPETEHFALFDYKRSPRTSGFVESLGRVEDLIQN
jgi:hypothetical protein